MDIALENEIPESLLPLFEELIPESYYDINFSNIYSQKPVPTKLYNLVINNLDPKHIGLTLIGFNQLKQLIKDGEQLFEDLYPNLYFPVPVNILAFLSPMQVNDILSYVDSLGIEIPNNILLNSKYFLNQQIKLGKGTYGRVVTGYDISTRQPVAIKQIHISSNALQQGDRIAYHMVELIALDHIADQCHDKRIICRRDFYLHNEILYIVTDLYSRKTLDIFIKDAYYDFLSVPDRDRLYSGIPIDIAYSIIHSLIKSLNYYHSQGLVHNDIKPDNILIAIVNPSKNANRIPIPILIDLGLTCSTLQYNGVYPFPIKCQYGIPRTTTFAESPEKAKKYLTQKDSSRAFLNGRIILSDPSRDAIKSDIWALGIVCYYLINGIYPYRFQLNTEATDKYFKDILIKGRHLCSSSRDVYLDQLIEWMLTRDPNIRPDTSQLLDELEDQSVSKLIRLSRIPSGGSLCLP